MKADTDLLTAEQVEHSQYANCKRLNDGDGLFLLLEPRGKSWRFRYTRAGRDALMSLGVYPAVGLQEARRKAADARALLARGEDPQAARRRERDQQWLETTKTFGVVAAEYNAKQTHRAKKTQERCERNFHYSAKLHGKTFGQLDRPTLLQCCRALEQAGKHDTAHRLGIYFTQVFRYARDEGYYRGDDPTLGGFGKSLKPVQEQHQAALVAPADVGGLMRNIDAWEWLATDRASTGATVGRALQLLARTAVRNSELRCAEWSEIDLEGRHPRHAGQPTWVIPLHRMKMREDGRVADHVVPLSRQACAILLAQYELTGHSRYVFPNARSDVRPMTDAALSTALVALGYRDKHVPHGFRTTFKTLAQDTLHAESEVVERQLAHKWGSEIAATYDAIQRLAERRLLMQAYSDLLDRLRDG